MGATMCGECGGEMGEDVHRCPDAAGFDGSFEAALRAMKLGKWARRAAWDEWQWKCIRDGEFVYALTGESVSECDCGPDCSFTDYNLLQNDWMVRDA